MWVSVFVRLHMGVGLSVLSVLTVLTVLSALPVLTVLTVLSPHKYALYKQLFLYFREVRTRLPELAEFNVRTYVRTQMHFLPKLAPSAHTMAMATALRQTWRCAQKKVARFRFNFGAVSL